MRKFLIIALTSLAAMAAHAWEPTVVDAAPEEVSAQASPNEAFVTIAPVPMPAAVIERISYAPQGTGLRQSKKVKAAKVARAKSILSRSVREQIVLVRARANADDQVWLSASDNEDEETGLDELDLHRSFRQPKVAKLPDQADDGDEASIDLPSHVKLRLLMARSNAVDAYILSQVGKAAQSADDELSDTVKLRLSIARARAVQALSDKYGPA